MDYVGKKERKYTVKQANEAILRYGHLTGIRGGVRRYILDKDMPVFKMAWKQDEWNASHWTERVIINMIIPAGSIVYMGSNCGFAKCRANKALVYSIFTHKGEAVGSAHSDRYIGFIYYKGKPVTPKRFEDDFKVCASGIHFFVDVKSAVLYR